MNKKDLIHERLLEHYKFAQEHGFEVVCVMLQGSQNYGLDVYSDNYKSDVDTKAIVLPSFEDFCRTREPVSKTLILPNNEHCDVKDVRIMFKTFEKQNINFIEILFTKYYIINSKYVDLVIELFEMSNDIAHINWNQSLNCIAGMSQEKLHAMEHPYPTTKDKIDKYGYDPKQLHHILRMNDFIKKFVRGTPYDKCLIPDDVEYLKKIKTTPIPLEQARELAITVDKQTYEIKEKYKKTFNVIRCDVIDRLNNLSYKLIRRYFLDELSNNKI